MTYTEARHAAREDRTRYSIEAREGALPSITVKKLSIVKLARAAMVLSGWRTGWAMCFDTKGGVGRQSHPVA